MPKRDKQQTATIVQASLEGQHFVVLASGNPDSVSRTLKSHAAECQHCNTRFTVNAGVQPFCIQCGSDEVEPIQNPVGNEEADNALELPDDSELSTLRCPSCLTSSILKDETATLYGGSIHCAACGESILYVTAQDDVVENMDDEGTQDQMADDELDLGDQGQQADDQLDVGQQDADDQQDQDQSQSQDQDHQQADDEVDTQDQGQQDACKTNAEVEVSLLKCVKGGDLNLITANDTLWAIVGGVPIASLSREKAGDNKDIFNKRAFAEAITATVNKIGVSSALEAYGFTPIMVKFPFAEQVEATAQAAVKENSVKVEATLKTLRDDYRQCLALAAVGLTKNFFRGQDHALKAAFYEELTQAGVSRPQKIIEKVFANFSEPYHKTLFALADSLLAKPLDVRNELAKTLGEVTTAELEDDEDDDTPDEQSASVESRLANPVVSIESKQALRSSQTASVRGLREATGGTFFHRIL
jgi:predicted RNA-binding Zn-ribbon protein involved in translation (DUF1610 family)